MCHPTGNKIAEAVGADPKKLEAMIVEVASKVVASAGVKLGGAGPSASAGVFRAGVQMHAAAHLWQAWAAEIMLACLVGVRRTQWRMHPYASGGWLFSSRPPALVVALTPPPFSPLLAPRCARLQVMTARTTGAHAWPPRPRRVSRHCRGDVVHASVGFQFRGRCRV